jgi:hypothetical protein
MLLIVFRLGVAIVNSREIEEYTVPPASAKILITGSPKPSTECESYTAIIS